MTEQQLLPRWWRSRGGGGVAPGLVPAPPQDRAQRGLRHKLPQGEGPLASGGRETEELVQ